VPVLDGVTEALPVTAPVAAVLFQQLKESKKERAEGKSTHMCFPAERQNRTTSVSLDTHSAASLELRSSSNDGWRSC